MYRLFLASATIISICAGEPRTPRIYNVLISTKKNLSPSHAVPIYEPVIRATSFGYALPPLVYHTQIDQNAPQTDGYIRGNPAIQELTQEIIKSPKVSIAGSEEAGIRKINSGDLGPEPGRYIPEAPGLESIQPAQLAGSIQSSTAQEAESPVPLQPVPLSPTQLKLDNDRITKNLKEPVQPLPVEHFVSYYNPYTIPNYSQYLPKEEVPKKPESKLLNFPPFFNKVDDPKQVIANFKKNSDIPDVPPPPIPVKTS